MTFKRSSDFQFTVSYPNEPILTVSVTGIDKALETINEKKRSIVKGPSVKVLINLDQSGIILIEEVYFYAELGKTEGIVGNVMNFFGGKKNEEQEEDIEESLDKPNDEKVVKKDTDEKEKEPANTVEKINLVFTVKQSIPPLSSTEKQDIKAEIHKMDTKDKIEAEQQEGINTLESLVYEIKYSIEEDHIIKISTPQERQELVKLVQSTQEWLEDNLGAVIADINTKKQALLTYWSPITHRKFEHANRDLNFVKLTDLVNYTRNFINETRVNTSKLSTDLITWYVPESEYTSIEDYLNEVDVWIIDTVKLQSEKKDHENPIVTVKEIERKIVSVGRRTATFVKSKTWKKGPGAPTTDAPVPPNEGESKDDKKEKDDPKEDDEIKDDEELKDDESKENDSKDEKKEEVNEEL